MKLLLILELRILDVCLEIDLEIIRREIEFIVIMYNEIFVLGV